MIHMHEAPACGPAGVVPAMNISVQISLLILSAAGLAVLAFAAASAVC